MGEAIAVANDGSLVTPKNPVIPFVPGDGIGQDIWGVAQTVFDRALEQSEGDRRVDWMEVMAGEKALHAVGDTLPKETIEAISKYHVAIKGPLTTPVGKGIRSVNVTLRRTLDLYACIRPVKYFPPVPSPVKHPELVDMVVFRENTEDVYCGLEWPRGSKEAEAVIQLVEQLSGRSIRRDSGIGIKPISEFGSKRLVRMAIEYALAQGRDSVTLVHKGNIMKFTEGGFKKWGYELAKAEYGAEAGADGRVSFKNPKNGHEIVVKDCIADAFLQNILLYPADYDVVAAMNLNGDYISDALAAQVGGIGIAPGANIGSECAIFEATHGTAPTIAGTGKANPGSIILSAELMLRHMGWEEAADLIVNSMEKTIESKQVTADFASQMENATTLTTSEFGEELVKNMQ